MAINAKQNISIRKKDLINSKLNSPIASKTVRFWHKATEGDTVIDLNDLNFPSSELPTAVQPSSSQLASMHLSLLKNNFKLYSFLEGELQQHDSFKVRDNYTIELTGGMSSGAQADEIFMGEVNLVPTDKIVVSDSREIWRTYPLTVSQTIVSLGETFKIRNLNFQIGSILIMKNGVGLSRCVGNVITNDGDYIEVDAGNGNSSSIQLKVAAIADDFLTVYFGIQFSGDLAMWEQVEALTGAVHKLSIDCAEGLHDDETSDRYLSANPSETDRRSFGDKVLSNENELVNITNRIDTIDKNLLINGLYKPYSQRKPSGTVDLTTSFAYQVLDRFMGKYSGNFNSIPTWEKQDNFSRMTGDFADGTGTLELQQRIESLLSWETVNKSLSLIFDIYSESCNQVTVELYYPTVEDDWSAETIIDSKTFNISLGTLTELKWEGFSSHASADKGLQLRVIFKNPQVTGSNKIHDVSKTKLSLGDKAQIWSPCGRDLIEEFQLCQRYFYFGSDNGGYFINSGSYFRTPDRHPVKMRCVPVLTTVSFSNGGQDNTDAGYAQVTDESMMWTTNVGSLPIYWDLIFKADAEL